MNVIRQQTARVTNNPVGALVGGVAGFYLAKKVCKQDMKYRNLCIIAGVVVGAIVGAMVQNKMKSKGAPSKEVVLQPVK